MGRERLPLVLTVSVVALLFGACGGDDDPTPFPTATIPPLTSGASATPADGPAAATPTTAPTAEVTPTEEPTPSPEPEPTVAPTEEPTAAPADPTAPAAPQPVAATEALGGRVFDRPIEFAPFEGNRVFVADQGGAVFTLDLDGGNEDILLDIRSQVSRGGNEEGLLSVALDPAFASNRHLWAYYSAANPRRSVLSRFTVGQFEADPATELVVLEVEQPFSNHNGGAIRFGPDGMLYLGLGDGGSGGDPLGSGQDRTTLLGSIIRIDVRNASAGTPYVVPADNPFASEEGAAPEIWAYGLRNPWRMAWDGGTLWLGDVGQNAIEEISIATRGANLGWNRLEGNQCFQGGCSSDGTVLPVAVYGHAGGRCSVSGGLVYRGAQTPEIAGSYLYGDFCSGEIWALPTDGSSQPVIVATGLGNVASFGVGPAGEVYVLRFGQPIVRLTSP